MTQEEFLAILGEKVVAVYALQKRVAELEAAVKQLTDAAKAEQKEAPHGETV